VAFELPGLALGHAAACGRRAVGHGVLEPTCSS
jgi:hypothetical protein